MSNPIKQTRTPIDFGITDEKGRAVGVVVVDTTYAFTEERTEGSQSWYEGPGDYVFTCVQPARNGGGFGASVSRKVFRTEEDTGRREYVDRRVASSKKRYLKKYAK